jgi:N-methylhydantoinase A
MDQTSAIKGRRKAFFPEEERFIETPVYDRYRLAPGCTFSGPAIIEERECTTVVGFHSRFSVDRDLNIIIERDEKA